jgi:hypothetical protein
MVPEWHAATLEVDFDAQLLLHATQEIRDVRRQVKAEQVVGQQTLENQGRAGRDAKNFGWRKRDVPELRKRGVGILFAQMARRNR